MQMLLTIFLLPTLAGYIYLTKSVIESVETNWYSHSRLIIESILTGISLIYISYTFYNILLLELPDVSMDKTFHTNVKSLWECFIWPITNELNSSQNNNITFTTESMLSVLIAFFCAGVQRVMLACNMSLILKRLITVRDRLGGPFERILSVSMNTLTPVMITLKNRKVYIGLVLELPPLTPVSNRREYLNVLPIRSGYRQSENLELGEHFTDYTFLHSLLIDGGNPAADAFSHGIAIDAQEVMSVALWNGPVFQQFQENSRNDREIVNDAG